jgi:serine/threonine protein kinase
LNGAQALMPIMHHHRCLAQVLRGEPYSEKCDIWSFGVVLWELLQRQRPYADAAVPMFLLMMELGKGTLRLDPLPPERCTPGLAELLERCLSPLPADRPSFREILRLLDFEHKIVHDRAAGENHKCEHKIVHDRAAGENHKFEHRMVHDV